MILAALNPQIGRDLEKIVGQEFDRIEKQFACCRDQRGGMVRHKTTGEFLIGRFKHDTNRLGEPGLHFHNLVMNSTYDAERDRFVALDARKLFQARREFDGEVQAKVAQYFLEKGFTTVTGRSGVFEVAEVPSAAIDMFSTRAKAVQARIAELKEEVPRLPDWEIRERAVLDTRPKKVVCSSDELRRETKRRMDKAGLKITGPRCFKWVRVWGG
jgi:conjugative relaxase-like TrwC/TraI family protein